MANAKQYAMIPSFHGGLVVDRSAHLLGPTELAECVNFDPYPGRLTRRKGCSVVNTLSTSVVDKLIEFRMWDGALHRLAVSGANLTKWDATSLSSALATSTPGHEIYQNKVLLTDGADYTYYDGTTYASVPLPADAGAALAEAKRCLGVRQYLERLWFFGDPQSPYTLYYTQTGRHDYLKSDDMRVNILSADGYPIVEATEFLRSLVVFKHSGVWALFGDPTAANREVFRVAAPGVKAPRSIALGQGRIYYLSHSGVQALVTLDRDNLSTLSLTQNRIDTLLDKLYNPENAVGVAHNGRYYLAVQRNPLPGYNDTVLVYDQRFEADGALGPWAVYEGWNVASWVVGDDGELYYGDVVTGDIVKANDGYSDKGVTYSSRARTGLWHLGDVRAVKKVKSVHALTAPDADADSQAPILITVDNEDGTVATTLTPVSAPEPLIWDVTDPGWDVAFWDVGSIAYSVENVNLQARMFQASVVVQSTKDKGAVMGALAYVFRPKKIR